MRLLGSELLLFVSTAITIFSDGTRRRLDSYPGFAPLWDTIESPSMSVFKDQPIP